MSYYPPYAQAVPQMPPGWQIAYTAEGQMYYVDHNTQTTHWNLPPYVAAAPAPYGRGGADFGPRGRGGAARPGRVGIDHAKRKTKMCMNFESGTCSWGDRCAFAHGAHELQPQGTGPAQGYDQQMQQMQMGGVPPPAMVQEQQH